MLWDSGWVRQVDYAWYGVFCPKAAILGFASVVCRRPNFGPKTTFLNVETGQKWPSNDLFGV